MRPGPYLFVPKNDGIEKYLYAMVQQNGRGNYARFFTRNGARATDALQIPVETAQQFGFFVPMVAQFNTQNT